MRLLAMLVCGAAVGAGCRPPAPTPAPAAEPAPAPAPTPEPAPAPKSTGPNEGWPTAAEVLAYLDGKSIPLPEPNRPPGERDRNHVLKREEVEALEIKRDGTRGGDGSWDTPVNFILDTGAGRYMVISIVTHKLIEDKRTFSGFRVRDVLRK
jgi:hypothetical protein